MELFDDGVRIVPLKIVGDDGERLLTTLAPFFQLEWKVFHTPLSVPAVETVLVGPGTDQQIRHVTVLPLLTFNVEEDVQGQDGVFVGLFQGGLLHKAPVAFDLDFSLAGVALTVTALVLTDGFGRF